MRFKKKKKLALALNLFNETQFSKGKEIALSKVELCKLFEAAHEE